MKVRDLFLFVPTSDSLLRNSFHQLKLRGNKNLSERVSSPHLKYLAFTSAEQCKKNVLRDEIS